LLEKISFEVKSIIFKEFHIDNYFLKDISLLFSWILTMLIIHMFRN
jgi:hypothetical protein